MARGANNAVISEMQFKQKILQRAPAGLAGNTEEDGAALSQEK